MNDQFIQSLTINYQLLGKLVRKLTMNFTRHYFGTTRKNTPPSRICRNMLAQCIYQGCNKGGYCMRRARTFKYNLFPLHLAAASKLV